MHNKFWLKLSVSAVAILTTASLHAETIAFLGDGISTGGATHPALVFDGEQLKKIFANELDLRPEASYYQLLNQEGVNIEQPADAPRRLPLSAREFHHPLTWAFQSALQRVSVQFLDTEEYSWSYMFGRKQGFLAEQILIAARNGERSGDALRQIDRVLDATQSVAPRHTFLFFSGQDICSPDLEFATTPVEFARNIESAVRYFMRNAKSDRSVSDIWLVDPLGLLQIVTAPGILNHQVQAFGQTLSCRDLQAGRISARARPMLSPDYGIEDLFLTLVNQGPRNYCPSLFAIHEGPAELQVRLGTLISQYRLQLEKLVKKLQGAHPSFRVHHLKASADILLDGPDMANDCFHLNLNGQLKITRKMLEAVQAVQIK